MQQAIIKINDLESDLSSLKDEELKQTTFSLRERCLNGETLDKLLPEAFAVVREAGQRVLGMRHFDVQLLGGMALHSGRIAEMRTGEGKTFVATLGAYLHALSGQGVHVVTVNDYLASRDAEWMRPLYEFLGISVGVISPDQSLEAKRNAYAADITYGTNNEFGFDYLRDNMVFSKENRVQRGLNFAIIDEVDSILIDEARTPLIISGSVEDSSELYKKMNEIAPKLIKQESLPEEEEKESEEEPHGHYLFDEKLRQVELTEEGHEFVESLLRETGALPEDESLYLPHNLNLLHHVYAALRAHVLFTNNVEYIVRDKEVLLIDEHTGRTMSGRRLSEGLHQALEAKEGVPIQAESQTLASTTFQNYFRSYRVLSGMTGTADTEAYEFQQIYGLEVVVIPTHKPMVRKDYNDLVYLTIQEKYQAINKDVQDIVNKGCPVLVGTASIEASELLSSALKQQNIKHQVLNAKFHEKEAEIIAQAGKPGAVTIATNMAGRGTDIILGGNWEAEVAKIKNPNPEQIQAIKDQWIKQHDAVLDAGGLHIIGTERHESRRIDNQLRGRSGRQGDPGSSRFYLSLEDNLMRIFASERVKNFMKALGMEEGEAIEHSMVTNAIEKAQRKVEGRNFDIRKQLLEYDDVANDQREIIYQQRNDLLAAEDVSDNIVGMRCEIVNQLVSTHVPEDSMEEQWDVNGLEEELSRTFNVTFDIKAWVNSNEPLDRNKICEKILAGIMVLYKQKEELCGTEALRQFEKHILLGMLDEKWKEHLAVMDHLRQGIHLRGYAQKSPQQEYKRESFNLFQELLSDVKFETIKALSHAQVRDNEDMEEMERVRWEGMARNMHFEHEQVSGMALPDENEMSLDQQAYAEMAQPFVREDRKVGRNEVCPCGSGKKYKRCHGKI